jgi:hypothetical protein
MLSAELCGEVYVTGAEVVTVVVVVTSGADVSTSEVAAVVIFAVSALELSLLVGIFIASLVFDRLTVIDLLDTLYVATQIKTVPIIVAP